MSKLFITGATGYIGGDALYAIAAAHPDLEITAMVRTSDKGAKIAAQYSKIRLVYGDLDSTSVLTTEASQADVVLHCADADHVGAANALIAGLAQRPAGQKSYLIHTSGTGILAVEDIKADTWGEHRDKVYDDWDGIGQVTSLPDAAPHRVVDKIILGAGDAHPGKISTAIVCPPHIYGPGRGPDNQKSIQAYRMARAALTRGKGFQVGNGGNIWAEVHVRDLSIVFLELVTAALSPDGGKATWNAKGYYFAENGDREWGDVGRAIARAAKQKGLIESEEIDNVNAEEAEKLTRRGTILWGSNSRSKAVRARKLFGWDPKEKSVLELVPEIVESEARELGLIKGHAEKAAGTA